MKPSAVPAEPSWGYDCPVQALRWLAGVTADEARDRMEASGWRPELGSNLWQLAVGLSAYGRLDVVAGAGTGGTPRGFARRVPQGRWLLLVDDHVMALVDGELHNAHGWEDEPLTAVMTFLPRTEVS